MRIKIKETDKREEADNEFPWADRIIKVDGGYMAFESYDDYIDWLNQK